MALPLLTVGGGENCGGEDCGGEDCGGGGGDCGGYIFYIEYISILIHYPDCVQWLS